MSQIDPSRYGVDELLRDGRSIHIRAIRPDDKARLLEHFESLSARSVYFRFFNAKRRLTDDGTRVPLIFAGPGVTAGQRCSRPAELLDIYPTLVELCGLTPRDDLEGVSLVPQLMDAGAPRERPAITSHNQGNHGIRSERWRYIRYADGREELYDYEQDPREWTNLAGRSEFAGVIAEHRRWLPPIDHWLISWIPGPIWFLLKITFVFFMFAMVKAMVPRYRYDQLMRLGWKVFLPLSLAMVVAVAAILHFGGLAP